ncbi:MAG: Na+/H+ antiporter NhaA [Ignavibacteriaceae bacterium]|nr:Na+/H+ antiporter NhaA [Ignavibacterium sp.]MCC6255249.1 Na+/H+ antiporter NhaA [Ignavibacteriaceae bacterium]HRN26118.1 Na+/H+ antiporter NhaA [Ignavibacteriaceae bacterium]HRP92588.1 Na+/H+ antiporter NhaA [Ignavibacteriaceae bacterium]HRQ53727.1 Na+/H+ antiporter NhaA [Ignavibacteriaceae bacterium]
MKHDQPKTPIERLTYPIQEFLHQEASGGILLIIATVIALAWANSPFADSYHSLWHTYFTIDLAGMSLKYSLHHWINDGLMVIFFFVVGLEIKRELFVGELSSAKKAALPIAAALGGMVFPALIYFFFNSGTEASSGWGIPMATDIAFVVGILALLGKRVPLSLKIFILALAIVDDLGAVLVIAFFYTSNISFTSLIIAGGLIVLLIALNKMGVRNLLIYTFVGIVLWLAFLKSGVHATVAGVLLAFTIPVSSRINTKKFKNETENLLKDFDNAGEHGEDVLTNSERLTIIDHIENNCEKILTPLQRFEQGLHPWVSFLIMPVFALANAGVTIGAGFSSALTHSVSLGIIFGLFIGKQIGIFGFSYLAVKLKIASVPEGVSWKKIYAASIIAGIGFTMSLFIANLAFDSEELLNIAKVGILSASLISGIIGFLILKSALKKM